MIKMKRILIYVISAFLLVSCASTPDIVEGITPSVDIDMTIEARVVAEVQAGVNATLVAQITPTPILPTATPVLTDTPTPVLPTDTPMPTNTPTPVPPSPTPTPDPRLFWDDFELGIKPKWGMLGDNFAVANGKLIMGDGSLESQIIGDSGWQNYAIRLYGLDVPGRQTGQSFNILVRVQDRDNYIRLEIRDHGANGKQWHWHKVINGQSQEIPGTHFGMRPSGSEFIMLEIQDNIYRTFIDGEQQVYFVDDTFSNGGIVMKCNHEFSLDAIEIVGMP